MDVYWHSQWCRYMGHTDVGLYSTVCGKMVMTMCTSSCIVLSLCSLWCPIIMVVVLGSSSVTILA